MLKSIYIIRNTENDKVYIGQTKNVPTRWSKHISDAKKNTGCLINKEMYKIGIDKFYYQILESDICNFDEREQYWIKFYNSLYPNGYNIVKGGVGSGVDNAFSIFDSLEDIYVIIEYIKNTKMKFHTIAQMYGCSDEVIVAINQGKRFRIDGYEYPIRTKKKDIDKIKQIVYSLKYERDKSIAEIAKEYNEDRHLIGEINSGKKYPLPNTKYPIRTKQDANPVYNHINEIIDLLKNTNIEQKEIAKKFNVSFSCISGINKGRFFRNENEVYPIRKNYQRCNGGRKSLTPNEIREIEGLLKETDLSIRDIASEFESGITIIMNINNGSILKYRNPDIEYPIRHK